MMRSKDQPVEPETAELVATVLEREQLASAAKTAVPRRQLSPAQLVVLWSLRIYLLFMIAVVIYQVWAATAQQ